jgi:hypothetical protein
MQRLLVELRASRSRHGDYGATIVDRPVLHRKTRALAPHSHAIDAAVCIATGVMTHGCACHRPRPEHDACAGNAACRIFRVLAVHDRAGWRRVEAESCKPQQSAGGNPRGCE